MSAWAAIRAACMCSLLTGLPLPGLPVSWEPQDPEGGKPPLADVAKMDWIYLDEGGGKGDRERMCWGEGGLEP